MLPPRLLALPLLLGLAALACAQDTTPAPEEAAPPASFVDRLREAGLGIVSGPATVKLGEVAELRLPAEHHAVESASIEKFYALTENIYGGNEVGVVMGPGGWMLFFDYEDVGYVKDDEKDKLDASALLKTMRENQSEANKMRSKQGWDEMQLKGWAAEPHYDPQTQNLKWALTLTSSSDNHQAAWINENIRLLGRGGVMNVTLVTDTDTFAEDARTADALLAQNFSYVAGHRYAEFKQGDKVAQYGLAALVLGGAGAVAYKAGFLQKFWKIIAAGVVAVAALAKRLWNRISGRDPV